MFACEMAIDKLWEYLQKFKVFYSVFKKGFFSVVYNDDSYLQGDSYEERLSNVLNTVEISRSLGFTMYLDKSSFSPSQCITYLGFYLESAQMTINLTPEK